MLAEGDDPNDPIVDASRAILDGHIVLSRGMADAGIYPAIDVESSVSRAMTQFVGESQQQLITRFRRVHSIYQENRDLISVGAYQPGSNPALDEAVALWPSILEFLRQPHTECVDANRSLADLRELFDASQSAGSDETS